MTALVFGLDPALNSPGAAILIERELVVADNVYIPPSLRDLPIAQRVDEVSQLCADWFFDRFGGDWTLSAKTITVAYEKPQVYGGPRSEDPNDLIHLAMVASSFWTMMRQRGATSVHAPTPREWNRGTKKLKKNVPELWLAQRGAMIARHVTKAERVLIPDKHDAVDAVGIALHAVGRLEPIRVNARPRATRV